MSRRAARLFRDSVLFLRLNRLGRVPPSLYAAELLIEAGVTVVALEYGRGDEPTSLHPGKVPRVRWGAPWARWLPRPLRAASIWLTTLVRLALQFGTGNRPRLVFATGIAETAMAYVLKLLLRVRYASHVLEVYERHDVHGFLRFLFWLEGPSLRAAEWLVFPMPERLAVYRERYRLTGRHHLVFNCPRLRPTVAAPALAQYGIPPGAVTMTYIGGIGRNGMVLETVAALPEFPDLHFLIAGWCEPDYERRLRDTIATLRLEDRVHYIGVTDDRWSCLDGADIALCVYRPDSLGTRFSTTSSNKVLEALAAGCAVILGDTAPARAWLAQTECGEICERYDAAGAAAALRRLLADRTRLETMRRRARTLHTTTLNFEHQFAPVIAREFSSSPKP